MIKHHPKFELIQAFVNGDLPASLSAGIAIHADMCPKCKQQIMQLTDEIAETSFENTIDNNVEFTAFDSAEISSNSDITPMNFDEMLNEITQSDELFKAEPSVMKNISFKNKSYTLPSALNNMAIGNTLHLGKLSRARIQLNESEVHTSLLQIQPGGGVPQHTHKGFELTLLLDGSFSDEEGEYVEGDFIMRDSSHKHQPVSEQGCLCYTVANDALHFTQGINKLLNPIGTFIY